MEEALVWLFYGWSTIAGSWLYGCAYNAGKERKR